MSSPNIDDAAALITIPTAPEAGSEFAPFSPNCSESAHQKLGLIADERIGTLSIAASARDRTAGRRKIVLYGLNFAPELTGVGKFTAEMAAWLVRQGHEVRVITGMPYYPDWKIAQEYRGRGYCVEDWHGVKVFRAPVWVPAQPSGGRRVLHLMSFALSSLPTLLAQVFWRPDMVWCVAPALVCAPAAALTAKLGGAVSWLHLQDFEIDAAFEMKMLRGSILRKLALAGERALVRCFDRISTISHQMVARIVEKGVDARRCLLFPNWVDTDSIRPLASKTAYRRELGIPEDAFVALFSGTMGAKQSLEVVARAAQALHAQSDIHFVFCGQGEGRPSIEAACAELPRVHFLPLQPVERIGELLATADVHLLPQQRAAADLVLPSKLTGMLASGRPVLATVESGTEIARWLEGCGHYVAPDDSAAMAETLLALARSPDRGRALGERARERAVEKLSLAAVLQEFNRAMEASILARASA